MHTWIAYKMAVLDCHAEFPDQRDGQAHVNALHVFDDDLWKTIPDHLDPFYLDERLPAWLEFVRNAMEEK